MLLNDKDLAMHTEFTASVKVCNPLGLHLRPASQLVKISGKFPDCEITLYKDNQGVNAKSIMGVIMLAAEQGSTLTVSANGENAQEAVHAIVELIANGFGEA